MREVITADLVVYATGYRSGDPLALLSNVAVRTEEIGTEEIVASIAAGERQGWQAAPGVVAVPTPNGSRSRGSGVGDQRPSTGA